jgi:hypothetical protein
MKSDIVKLKEILKPYKGKLMYDFKTGELLGDVWFVSVKSLGTSDQIDVASKVIKDIFKQDNLALMHSNHEIEWLKELAIMKIKHLKNRKFDAISLLYPEED